MLNFRKIAPFAFLLALGFATSCSVINGGVSNDPAVQALENDVKAQEAVAEQAKQQARSAEAELESRKSRLKAAKYQAKANRAVN